MKLNLIDSEENINNLANLVNEYKNKVDDKIVLNRVDKKNERRNCSLTYIIRNS